MSAGSLADPVLAHFGCAHCEACNQAALRLVEVLTRPWNGGHLLAACFNLSEVLTMERALLLNVGGWLTTLV